METYSHIDYLDDGTVRVRVTEVVRDKDGRAQNGAELLSYTYPADTPARVPLRKRIEAETVSKLLEAEAQPASAGVVG